MSIKLIAIDMDGTLLNQHSQLSQATIKTVAKAKAQGVQIVLCTGRPLTGVTPFLKQLNLKEPGDHVITFNGALVQQTNDGKVILRHSLTYQQYLQLEQLAQQIGVHCHVEDDEAMYTANRDISKYTVLEAYQVSMPLKYQLPEEFSSDQQFAKVMLIDDPKVLAAAQKKIPQALFDQYYFVNSEPYFLEALNKKASKGNAVTELAGKLGYSMDEVMALGDQGNDLPMIQAAGLGVAMGNAIPAVKKAAQVITATNAEDGAAKAIEKYALQ